MSRRDSSIPLMASSLRGSSSSAISISRLITSSKVSRGVALHSCQPLPCLLRHPCCCPGMLCSIEGSLDTTVTISEIPQHHQAPLGPQHQPGEQEHHHVVRVIDGGCRPSTSRSAGGRDAGGTPAHGESSQPGSLPALTTCLHHHIADPPHRVRRARKRDRPGKYPSVLVARSAATIH